MAYHPRIETSDQGTFITTRTRNSELWFANNRAVERFTLGLLAKLKDRYKFNLYAFAIEGSHIHVDAIFPLMNRADFARDFNSGVAKAVARLTPHFPGGRLWARRYSGELLPDDKSIERQFFYTVLQPVKDNLVDKISDYPFYNCFHDAICGIKRKFKVVNWARYNDVKRYNSKARVKDFIQIYCLSYERLPGYEHLSQHDYRVMMEKRLEEHRQRIIRERRANGKSEPLGALSLQRTIPGKLAKNPKHSTPLSYRPRVIAGSRTSYQGAIAWYFSIYLQYKEASLRFRAGELDVEFPPGTHRPPSWQVVRPSGPYSPYRIQHATRLIAQRLDPHKIA